MKSALPTFFSALAVGAVCYILAMASWQQVLMLFLCASFGWCLFVWRRERQNEIYGPKRTVKSQAEVIQSYTAPKRELPPPAAIASEQPRTIYRFPIHNLARPAN